MKRKAGFCTLVIVIACLFSIKNAVSQTSSNKTEYSPDKTLKSSARINPTTLGMEFSIPLPSYPGRAGTALPNSISYSSKVWGVGVPRIYTTSSGTHQEITAQYAKGSWAGWTSTLGVPQLDTTVEAYTEDGNAWVYDPTLDPLDPNADYNLVYVKKFRVVMPDGSVHELRADDGTHPYGTAINPGVSDANFYSGTFLSVDGSRMRLEFDATTYVSTLYMPDGSRYVNLPQWNSGSVGSGTTFYDVHGNKMTYTSSLVNGSYVYSWTDTMGRSLQDPLPRSGLSGQPTAAATPTLNYPTRTSGGASPAAQNVQYTWASLSTQQSSLSYVSQVICAGASTNSIPSGSTYLFGSTGTLPRVCPGWSGTFNPIVLTAVTLPNGAKYSFHYNIYGEVDRIDYPTGGYERFVYAQADPIAAVGDWKYDQFNRIVTDRYISSDGTSGSEVHWQYAVQKESNGSTTGPYHSKTYAPDGSWSEQLIVDEYGIDPPAAYGYGALPPAKPYEIRVYKDTSTNALLRRTLLSYTSTGPLTIGGVTGCEFAYRDIRPDKEIEMIFEPDSGSTSALATMTEHVYDTTGNSDPGYFS